MPPHDAEWAGTGRELFAGFRAIVGTAETGASVIRPCPPPWKRPPLPSTSDSLLSIVPVVPVVVIHDLDHAVPVARALVEGGLPVIELTLRTPDALEAIHAIATQVPEILVGAGTIVTPGQVKEAVDAGAQFLVSPGATPTLLAAMAASDLPFLPGTATVSEALAVLEAGFSEMKFFPAEASGGAAYLKSIASPLPTACFCPTGEITAASAPSYLSLPNVGCVGGSWLTPADA